MSTNVTIKNIGKIGLVSTSSLLFASIATAQPVPDETLPNNSEVILEGNTYQINGGTVAGKNLFHSFEQFSVPTGKAALFNNDSTIQNIISRVTGNSLTTIDGFLSVNGNANLFFLNPNGVLFGSNSTLNISGSLIVTTADSFQFADGTEFSATNPQVSPLLTISTPMGLQFGDKVGEITNQSGNLISPLGQTIALIGGDINLRGGLILSENRTTIPFSGNIELGSVDSNSQVYLIPTEVGWTFDYKNVQNFRDITLTQAVNAVDRESDFPAILIGADIQIQGNKVSIREGKQILVSNNLRINASDTLNVSGFGPALMPGQFVSSRLVSTAFDELDGGDIIINTGRLVLQDGGTIFSNVGGNLEENTREIIPAKGNGGDITINVAELIEITDESSGIFSSTAGFGLAGNIVINTKDLIIGNGARISADSTGKTALGRPIATGLGGEIEIKADESIKLNGGFISSTTNGLGDDAGNVRLETEHLSILEKAEISVSTDGSGSTGNLEILANSIELDRGFLSAKTTAGDKGNIIIGNADSLLIRNNSRISTDARGRATGGNITITADVIAALNNSDITSNAQQGRAGRIEINAQDGVLGIRPREQESPNTSDITAISELGVEFNGEVIFNVPDVDPTSGIFRLASVPIDAGKIFAQNLCKFEDGQIAKGSSFIVTGKGGFMPTAADPVGDRDRVVNWASRDDLKVSKDGSVVVRQRSEPEILAQSDRPMEQAQGLIIASDGSIWLTTESPQVTLQNSIIPHLNCHSLFH